MATVKNKKFVSPASNEVHVVRANWKFSVDSGSSASAFELIEATDDVVLIDGYVKTITVPDSAAGTATFSFGKTGAATGLINAGATSAFVLENIVALTDATTPLELEDGQKILLTIGTQDATAGELEFVGVFLKK